MVDKGINYYTSQNDDTKCPVIERLIRTLRSRIARYLLANNTWKYIGALQEIVMGYNLSPHRSIGMAPALVDASNEQEVFKKLFPNPKPNLNSIKYKFEINDPVRIVIKPSKFTKGFATQWTEEIFSVVERLKTSPPRYRIADAHKETLIGSFYEPELITAKTPFGRERVSAIECIIKVRKRKGIKEALVKYRGYPASMNAWVREADIIDV